MPQALGGWAAVLRFGSSIGPNLDRTALPDDIVASIGAGVALQPPIAASYTAALRAEWAARGGGHAQRAAAAVPTFNLRLLAPAAVSGRAGCTWMTLTWDFFST